MNQYDKLSNLKDYLSSLGSVAVAFSGGVDSTLLLKVAHETLKDQCIAITARSESFPQRELNEAIAFCEAEGIRQIICDSNELDIEGFKDNPVNRCYICKKELFSTMKAIAEREGFNAIVEGSNMDDNGDYRPGLKAIAELDIKSPLRHAALYKNEIRALSKEMGLKTFDKPSFACLASRFVYGERISEEKLAMVDKAEQLLLDLGFRQVRVRIHGKMARIEVAPEEMNRLLDENIRDAINTAFTLYGFTYVTLDLKGYRTGSMNETLSRETKKNEMEIK